MKKAIQFTLLVIILIGLNSCEKKQSHVVYDKAYIDQIKAAREEIGKNIKLSFIPGANVAVAKDGKIIYSEAFGMASRDLEVPVSRDTKFRIGSLSEIFTSLIYLKMVEEGKLHPDSSIQHYYPEFPEKEYKVRLLDLVHHISGMREPKYSEDNNVRINVSMERGIEDFKNDPLASAPAIYQIPSRFNYDLLGMIMEKASGKNYRQLLKQYVTDTLQLNNTLVDNPFTTVKDRSDFYDFNLVSQVTNAIFKDNRYCAPSSGLLSNAEDIVKLGMVFLESDYLSDKTRETLFEPVKLFDGIPSSLAHGWFILTNDGISNFYGRSGFTRGGSAALLIYPEEKLVISWASNLTGSMDSPPIIKIAEHFLPNSEENSETSILE